MKIFDSPKLCRYAADTAVHPEYRRRGIYNKLIELSNIYAGKPGTDIVYYVSSNPVLVEKWSKTRRSFPYNVLNLVWIADVDKQLEAMPMKYPYLVKTGVKGLQTFKKLRETLSKEPETCPYVINEVTSYDQRIDSFWEKIDHNYRFITIRNRDYLNWRFCDPRAGRYHIFQAEDNGEIQGYISLFVNRLNKKYPIGFIADLLTLPEKKGVTESLIMNALEFFKDNKVNIINCQVVQGHSNEIALKKLGFIDTRIRLHLFYRNYKEPDPVKKLSDTSPNMMHFNYSDIDSMPTNPPKAR
jgi:hypothetical protein